MKHMQYSNDVFISYAQSDNIPFGNQSPWVNQFHLDLQNKLGELLGREAVVWRDNLLQGGHIVEEEIGRQMRQSAVFVCILSPAYMSQKLESECASFEQWAGDALKAGPFSRIVKVEKMPVEESALPDGIKELNGSAFFEIDPQRGRPKAFKQGGEAYLEKIEDLAYDIKDILDAIENPGAAIKVEKQAIVPKKPHSSETKILFLAAQATDSGRIRMDQEMRDIREGLLRSKNRDHFLLESRFALRPQDLSRAILDTEPRIVHFSGNAGIMGGGILLEGNQGQAQLVSGAALSGLFELFKDQIECVFLNACHTADQLDAIAKHIPYVIGLKSVMSEEAQVNFAVGFYDALGAGRDIEFAFKMATVGINLAGLDGNDMPVLKTAT